MLEAIADGDANRQLEQVRNFIARRVDGIIVVPKDAKSIIPMIKAANEAGIPIVLFNRPPDPSDARSVAVVADNLGIARATVEHLCALARKTGKKQKAAILVGDLGDVNAIGRRDGFDQAAAACADAIEVVARIPTEWNQEKALAGVTNALQAHPDLGLVFTSSDFMLPSIASALKGGGPVPQGGRGGPRHPGRLRRRRDRLADARGGLPRRDRRPGRLLRGRGGGRRRSCDLKAGKAVPPRDPRPGLRHPPGQQGRDGAAACGERRSRGKKAGAA